MDHREAFNAISKRIQKRLEKFPGYSCKNYRMDDEIRIGIRIGSHSTVMIVARAFRTYLEIQVRTRSLDGDYGSFYIEVRYNQKFSFKKIGARIASIISHRIELGVGKNYKLIYVLKDDQDLLRKK